MIDKEFIGKITSVTGKITTTKEEGEALPDGFLRIKIESDSIDYETLALKYPSIAATLLNISPIPFKSISWGDQSEYGMGLIVQLYFQDMLPGMSEPEPCSVDGITIVNIDTRISDDIPTYIFTIDVPYHNSDMKVLFKYLKSVIKFTFVKTSLD